MKYEQEKINPYNQKGEKSRQVEMMFDSIAYTYDKLNHRLSWDIDKTWRRKAIKALAPFHPKQILDIATGTGDFAILATKMLHPEKMMATDISEGMMDKGREKTSHMGLADKISFQRENCEQLSFADETFDAVTVAFGIRNFANLDKGLKEMFRVTKHGGKVCILELSTPVKSPMKQLFSIYSNTILPLYGRMVSKDKNAYTYLTKTIEAFPQAEQMTGILKKAGAKDVQFKRLTWGICTLYLASK